MQLFFLLALAASASAFVCPPVEEGARKRLGEQCGGTCSTYGECAEGLECHVEQLTTSPMSFAIIVGGAKKAGVCRAIHGYEPAIEPEDDEEVEPRRRAQLAGGTSQTSIDSPEVLAASKYAMQMLMRRSNSLDAPNLTRIVSAQTQVVAGIKYTLHLVLSDGSEHRVQVVDQPWMTPRYSFVNDELL